LARESNIYIKRRKKNFLKVYNKLLDFGKKKKKISDLSQNIYL